MTTFLLPRLSRLGVRRLADELGEGYSTATAKSFLSDHSSLGGFGASGGLRDARSFEALADRLREIAVKCNMPSPPGTTAKAMFDRDAAIALGECVILRSAEALRDDVWAYLAAVLLPDVVRWRFGKAPAERYLGGVRNTFQRLWMRAWALDLGAGNLERWTLLRGLSEDAHVAIFERPSIGGNAVLAKASAAEWLRVSEVIGRGAMEEVMRRSIKVLRLKHQIIDLSVLSDEDVQQQVKEAFALAVDDLTATK
ncbi:hypothetical protein [uncultured Stenotrophomonas sp.]|uniref:hypothetical protein n=1 Tax=uncultured Stenotrophomonas sp. TaxID=165438 RepID=UPI0028E7FD54|nr:hypothetical protein [uncultured Stenotrophomonas sp.]